MRGAAGKALRAAALGLFFASTWQAAIAAGPADGPRGHLVLNGGGKRPKVVMDKFVELAGGRDASILIVPTASEESDTGTYYQNVLASEQGCTRVTTLKISSRKDAEREELVRLVEGAGGVFFAGGDQRRITAALLDTPVGEAIAKAYRRGAALGGTSAGTACMSGLMLTGEGDFTVLRKGAVELKPGLNLFPFAILDQHFVARGRQNRLISAVLEHPEFLGIGVDEATAVWLRPDLTFEVLGEGWVFVFDAFQARSAGAIVAEPASCEPRVTVTQREADSRTNLGARNLRTHILLAGDVFDLSSRSVLTARKDPSPSRSPNLPSGGP